MTDKVVFYGSLGYYITDLNSMLAQFSETLMDSSSLRIATVGYQMQLPIISGTHQGDKFVLPKYIGYLLFNENFNIVFILKGYLI